MHTTINIAETSIQEEIRDGQRWLVAKNVPIVKPTVLSNGYVPEQSVSASTAAENTYGGTGWGGLPATLEHPRNLPAHSWFDPSRPRGEPVVSANVGAEDELGVGQLENDRWDGEYVRVDIAVNVDRAEDLGDGGEQVVAALEDGDPLDVSTHYVGARLPPGEYDGEHRDEAEAIAAPDALALLPNAPGECSIEDGCGVNAPATAPIPTANDATSVAVTTGHHATANVTDDPAWSSLGGELNRIRDLVGQAIGSWRSLDEDQDGDGSLPGEATANAEALSREAVLQEAVTANQFPDEFPFGDKEACFDELGGRVDDEEGFCVSWYDSVHETDASANSDGQATTGAESPTGDSGQTATANMDREELIRKIMEHSNIKKESLEGMGDSCLQTTADHIVGDGSGDDDGNGDGGDGGDGGGDDTGADGGDGDGDGGDGTPDGADTDTDTDGDTVLVQLPDEHDSIDDYIDSQVDQAVTANRERLEREDRVDRIVANSAEYDDDDREELMETPDGVLDRIEQGLEAGTQVPAASGASVSANAGAGDDVDLDELDVGTGQIDEIGAEGGD